MPFAVRKRGGRKLVITPEGETHRPRPRVDSALVKALARAHRWQRRLMVSAMPTTSSHG